MHGIVPPEAASENRSTYSVEALWEELCFDRYDVYYVKSCLVKLQTMLRTDQKYTRQRRSLAFQRV